MIYQRHLQTQSRRGIFAKTRFLCTSRKYVTHEKMVVYNIHVCFVFKKQSLNIFKIMLMLGRCVLSIPKLVTCTKKIADTRVKLSHNMLICILFQNSVDKIISMDVDATDPNGNFLLFTLQTSPGNSSILYSYEINKPSNRKKRQTRQKVL